jgi:hypothetical protein
MDLNLIFLALAVFGASLQLYRERRELSPLRAYEILLIWLFAVALGFGNIVGGIREMLDGITLSVMQNGFLYPVSGTAHILLGIAGIFCFQSGSRFRLAVIISGLVMGGCIAVVPLAPSETSETRWILPGSGMLFDLFLPLMLLALWLAQEHEVKKIGKSDL